MSKIGIDFGGVITRRVEGHQDTSFFGEQYITSPAEPGAFDGIKDITTDVGAENVWIVSKASQHTQLKTVNWLNASGFFELTGMKPDNIRFTHKRHDKAGVAKELGLTHFIDDSAEVLTYLSGLVTYLFLYNPSQESLKASKKIIPPPSVSYDWVTLRGLIRNTSD
jgi:hypothetical protein